MEFNIKNGNIEKQKSACLIVEVYEPNILSEQTKLLDKLSNGYISELVKSGDITGKLGQTLLLHNIPNILSDRILLVGCGQKNEINTKKYTQIITKVFNVLTETEITNATSFLSDIELPGFDTYWKIRKSIEILHKCSYSFNFLKSKQASKKYLEKFTFNISSRKDLNLGDAAIAHGNAISAGVSLCKDVANMPPNICNPAYLASQAKRLTEVYPTLEVTTFGEEQMTKLGMNSYLAVGRGSNNESIMTVVEYKGASIDQKPIVLIGKGLTFDSGGISLKPGAGMDEMKYDMCGAASIIGILKAICELNLPLNVIGVIAGCENMPDGNACRPGDILTSMSGQTIEVLNTDAEGRLVLCDVTVHS